MASACLNPISFSPECWFRRVKNVSDPTTNLSDLNINNNNINNKSDTTSFDGFQFQLEDMLPADELFSDGKLIPLVNKPDIATSSSTVLSSVDHSHRNVDQTDPFYSPRAPRCSSRWKQLLGLKKLHQSSNHNNAVKQDNNNIINNNNNNNNKRTTSFASSNKSIRQLLYKNPKPITDSSINLPLLKDTDYESASVSVSSRPSISSSSSGHDVDDLPRLSLDSDKPTKLNMNTNNRQRTRLAKTRTTQLTETRVGRPTGRRSTDTTLTANRCLSVDSPRINSSGKIVFHGLERSSSSPSSLIGGSRIKHRGMERSYSGNVRITPVLNVPVFGLQMFNSQQRREGCSSVNNGGSIRGQRFNGKLRGECC